MEQTHYAQGTLIWINHEEEVWLPASIVSSNDKELIVKTERDPDGCMILSPNESIFLRTLDGFTEAGLTVLDDLTQLTHLHEPAVLSSLQHRFDIDTIYTFTGPILIALNPFKNIPGLYDEEVLRSFINTKTSGGKPHVFSTSNSSYRGICDRQKSQTVLISGESGAGKTETTKHVMKFLALAGSEDGRVTDVEKQVLESNPLLEAFGNARTLRNDNSSRFGKFIELQFRTDEKQVLPVGSPSRLCGARIRTYLLEKVRVCDQQEGERNYHIFYEACAAAMTLSGTSVYNFPQVLDKDQVKDARTIDLEGFQDVGSFAFLTRSSCRTLKDVDDVKMFEFRINAMQTIGISPEDISNILKVVAAVLHLGNTKFDAPPNNSEGSMVMQECAASIDLAARLTGVARKDLEGALCNNTRVTRTERIRSPVNVRTAADNRDALARALYGMIFDFIVAMANTCIGYIEDVRLFVGVLDIFGFECFKMNSFEQVCINFTNERLQQFFNSFVFKLEERLYEREGIPWDPLDFPDNQDAVDILQAKGTGVFAILDEECMVPQGSDQGFCNKLIKQHKGHRRFDEIKTKPTWFVIKHFAGPVSYCTDGFLDKNKDQLSNDIIECMGGSENAFVATLFKNDKKYAEVLNPAPQDESSQPGGSKKKKKYTVSSEFKDQLSSLMDIVDLTEPHFIRCIKPNPHNLPDLYDRKGVTEQLRYGGVLQVVQVSRAGYPVRINHQECWDDYKILCEPKVITGFNYIDDPKIRANKLLEHLTVQLSIPKPAHGTSWAVGKTMVFFKLAAFERLKFARSELLIKSTTLIQACWRRRLKMRLYKTIHLCLVHSEALLRTKQARADLQRRRKLAAAGKIQAQARTMLQRRKFIEIRRKFVKVQARVRGIRGRRKAQEYKRNVSATKIQRQWLRLQDQRVYDKFKKAIYIAQERLRLRMAKQQMQKLKKEAKEVGTLMAKSQKAQEQANELRKRNDELEAVQLQLQSETKRLQAKVKTLEDQHVEMQQSLDEAKTQAEEAAKLAADQSKMVVETETLTRMQTQLEEKDTEITTLRTEVEELKSAQRDGAQKLQDAEQRYQQLLKSTAMQSTAGMTMGVGVGAAAASRAPARAGKSNRNVNIQLVGSQGVGKTSLLEELIRDQDPAQMPKFVEQRTNLMSHNQIQVGDKLLKLLDCSGNARAQHLVKEWFGRSCWVFVVYDMSNKDTLEHAMELTKEVHAAGARVVLFGNKWSVDQGKHVEVDVMAAKDVAVRCEGMAMESSSLIDAVKLVVAAGDEPEEAAVPAGLDPSSPDANRRSSISAAIDSVKSWFGGAERGRANQGVLRPSLKGTKSMKQARREGDVNADLRPVQELQDSESAVTCICFGQERLHKAYILLGTASKDGTVVIYRCYRTEMEIAFLQDQDFPQESDEMYSQPPADHSNIAVHSRLVGHSRAITSIFFNLLEDQLVTTSIDKSVRFWGIDSGEMLKVFTDSSPVPVATFLPFNPQVFVAANSNAVLRLVNVQNGMVLQKLKVETEVRALKFDDTGLFLLAGTKSGSIHVLEASDSSTLKFKFKVQLARGGVTCITFVPANYGQPPCLLVNTSDSSATIIDCTYGPPTGVLTNLAVRSRVRVAHSLLPLKCCYSPSGQGYLISGSEDKEVYIYSLAKASNYKMQYLKHHQVPVVAVAVNQQDTLLASADSLGRIVLWRRMDFSHLPDP
uniref:Myosin motor domain-containing protein n=1 Tax=Zooxanthella nutricula TaxID=1333877 RepID=A0A6U6W534_9DINO